MEGLGVRCVSTGDWVTAAETAECVLALDALGLDDHGAGLVHWGQGLRLPDGSYWTGMVYPDQETFPRASGRRTPPGPWCSPPTRCPTRRRPPGCSAGNACRPGSIWPSPLR